MSGKGSESNEDRQARRRKRLEARRAAYDTTIPSPCINICQVNNEDGLCIGCYRHVDEIREWPIMTAARKQEVLARIEGRKAARAKS